MENFNRLNDKYFKFLFANPDYKDLLIGFVNDVLDNTPKNVERLPPVVDLVYSNREAVPQSALDKTPRFDVMARTFDNRKLHIEVQVAYDPYLLQRLMNYASRSYAGDTHQGEPYSSVQIVFITLLNYNLFPDSEDWYELHRMINVATGAWRLRSMEFHFIDISKLRAKMIKEHAWPKTGLERWLYYLGSIGGKKNMETIAKEDSRVNKMIKLENIFREDPGLFAAYTDWEFEKKLYDATLRYAAIQDEDERKELDNISALVNFIERGCTTLPKAAALLGMTEAEFKAKMAKYNIKIDNA
ncbi:MAG: Rpn family recombination-promoting nuclease/putative transposase [Synergistaceae bacterium]|nr:Rpn family recombination-promoting nuclease/putative transposase [Synergistaceae bacterium]MBQ9896855.1 Rpn family recombination-promoting nuclease/putative transposase [Synergistaceae bacterium]MBR0097137.1 Rpn family recombination-promoting nuclease/putative transposase [Synergistaceae bacterium]